MSTSGDGEQQSSLQSLVQIPLIHIWIPTAFLSGGFKGKSHHIYQIYIRIKEEEWNVYRRYSQFYSLHKTLKSTHRQIGEFEFPPKKAIGNKDSKVVQERRKKLEFYLRNVINHIQTLNCDITNKDKLVQAIPFLRYAPFEFFQNSLLISILFCILSATNSFSKTDLILKQIFHNKSPILPQHPLQPSLSPTWVFRFIFSFFYFFSIFSPCILLLFYIFSLRSFLLFFNFFNYYFIV